MEFSEESLLPFEAQSRQIRAELLHVLEGFSGTVQSLLWEGLSRVARRELGAEVPLPAGWMDEKTGRFGIIKRGL